MMKLSPDGIRAYLAANTSSIRTASSIRSYRNMLHNLDVHCGGKDLGRYREGDLAGFCQKGSPAPHTVAQRRTIVRQFFAWARRAGLITVDPAVDLKEVVKVRVHNVRQSNWLTEPQVKALLAGCDDSVVGRRDRVLLTLGFNTGLRAFEITGLHWGAIDLNHKRLVVTGKGEKPAVVGISSKLHEALLDWHGTCPSGPVVPRTRSLSTFDGDRDIKLCVGDALTQSGLGQVLRRRGLTIGVPTLAPHDMRRTLAGILQGKEYPIEKISEALRHNSIATTEAYLEKNPHRAVETLQGLELDI